MKKIKKILLISFLILISSCNTNDEMSNNEFPKLSIENLSKDKRLIALLNNEQILRNKIKDISKIKEITSKENLSENDLLDLSLAIGFSSVEEHKNYFISQKKIFSSLEKDYGLSSFKQEEIREILVSSTINNSYQKSTNDPCNCFKIATNTTIEIGAAAVVAHLGCASLDLTIVGGIVCHAAVLVGQVAAENKNDAELENCLKECKEQTNNS